MAEYIERGKAIEEFTFADADVCQEYADYECEFGFSREAIKQVLSQMPAADVEHVVYGSWQYYRKQNKAVCTNCSFERDLEANFGKAVSCPNCGAKMNEGKREG